MLFWSFEIEPEQSEYFSESCSAGKALIIMSYLVPFWIEFAVDNSSGSFDSCGNISFIILL